MDNVDFNVSEFMAAPSAAYGDILQLKMKAEHHFLELDKDVHKSIQLQVNHLVKNHLTTMQLLRPVEDGTALMPQLATGKQVIRSVAVFDIADEPDKLPKEIQVGKLLVFYTNGFANDVFYVDTNKPLVVFCNDWFCSSELDDISKNIKPKKINRNKRKGKK